MGVTAQYTAKKLIAFTEPEAELLALLAENEGRTMSDIVRDALRAHAKRQPSLDRKALAKRLKELAGKKPAGSRRRAVEQDADGLLAYLSEADGSGIAGLTADRTMDSSELFGD